MSEKIFYVIPLILWALCLFFAAWGPPKEQGAEEWDEVDDTDQHGPCPYCDAETNDFIPLNQTVEYSGIEMALNRKGMLRARVYEPGKETFTTQDIVEIKHCPNCGAKMDGDSHD